MDCRKRARLKIALSKAYTAHREKAPADVLDAVASAMLAEDGRMRRSEGRRTGAIRFVCGQVRYIPAWTWAAQFAIVALMVVTSQSAGNSIAVRWAVGMMAAASVLVCVPTLSASRAYGVDELERACPNDAASVLVARLVIMGCSCALCVGLLVAALCRWSHVDALSVALWACPPFFTCSAGSLLILRRFRPSMAPVSCAVLTASLCALLLIIANAWPEAYDQAATGVWSLASLVAAAWTAAEAAALVRWTADGLNSPSQRAAHNAY